MTVIELARLVAEMRAKQREYFRTRSPALLDESKRLEKALDRAVEEVERPTLFGGGDG